MSREITAKQMRKKGEILKGEIIDEIYEPKKQLAKRKVKEKQPISLKTVLVYLLIPVFILGAAFIYYNLPSRVVLTENTSTSETDGFRISMNSTPTFANGKAKGKLMIVNAPANKNPQTVEIKRTDTNEVIYQSGQIPVAGKLLEDSLSSCLPKGEYDCIAKFSLINSSGEVVKTAEANILIKILN